MDPSEVKALTFDVFGTVVDWRASIIREGERLGAAKGIDVDWPAFADAWRRGYEPAMRRVRSGELPFKDPRHAHGSLMLEAEAKLKQVQRRLKPSLLVTCIAIPTLRPAQGERGYFWRHHQELV